MKTYKTHIATILILSVIFSILVLYTNFLPFVSEEEHLINFFHYSKNTDENRNDLIKNNFLLIDVSSDAGLGYKNEKDIGKNIDSIPLTNTVNRKKLSTLFRFLNDHDTLYNTIICDLFFEKHSLKDKFNCDYDSSLNYYVGELQEKPKNKILFAQDRDTSGKNISILNIQPQNYGSVGYESVSGTFVYEKLIFDSDTSLPFLMYERINNIELSKSKFKDSRFLPTLYQITDSNETNKRYVFNTFVPEVTYTTKDMNDWISSSRKSTLDKNVTVVNLNFLYRNPNRLIPLLDTKGSTKKNIFIGNLNPSGNTDIHATLFGKTTGSLSLLSTYFNLVMNYNEFNIFIYVWYFIIFVLIFSYYFFIANLEIPMGKRKIAKFFWVFVHFVLHHIHVLFLFLGSWLIFHSFNYVTRIVALAPLLLIVTYWIKIRTLSRYSKKDKTEALLESVEEIDSQ